MRSDVNRRKHNRGFTILETLVAAILTLLLLGVVFNVMSHARNETAKGYWLQGAITELRNGTRLLTSLLKRTSYPSTIEDIGGQKVVISYKEWRDYDEGGRLRNMLIKKDDHDLDLKLLPGTIIPDSQPVQLLVFPICIPEKQGVDGKITWIELILEPVPNFTSRTALGKLRLIEREDTYNSRGMPRRAYDLKKKFSTSLPVKSDKIIIRDVSEVEISDFSVEELRGISVAAAQGSAATEHTRSRFMISIYIKCTCLKDEKITLTDQCSIINNIDVSELALTNSIEVLAINGSGIFRTAKISVNGKSMVVSANQAVAGMFEVLSVFSNGIKVRFISGSKIRSFFVK